MYIVFRSYQNLCNPNRIYIFRLLFAYFGLEMKPFHYLLTLYILLPSVWSVYWRETENEREATNNTVFRKL